MLLENDLNDLLASFPTLPEGLLRACAVRGDVNAAKSWFSTLVSNGCLDDMEGSGSRLGQWINMDQLLYIYIYSFDVLVKHCDSLYLWMVIHCFMQR